MRLALTLHPPPRSKALVSAIIVSGPDSDVTLFPAQSHAFHLTITAVVGMALYQGVTALARNQIQINWWGGVLIVSAVSILTLPILAIPFIFGGITAKPLAHDRVDFRVKVSGEGVASGPRLSRWQLSWPPMSCAACAAA